MTKYGITTSKAHYWVHVCPLDAALYVYPVWMMREALGRLEPKEIPTAKGYLAPIYSLLRRNGGFIRPIQADYPFFHKWNWQAAERDADVGAMGEECVKALADRGDFLMPVKLLFQDGLDFQFSGIDFTCEFPVADPLIEVKTDLPGGIWGTGNLFVQTHESQHKEKRA